jgi:hypothetical protein
MKSTLAIGLAMLLVACSSSPRYNSYSNYSNSYTPVYKPQVSNSYVKPVAQTNYSQSNYVKTSSQAAAPVKVPVTPLETGAGAAVVFVAVGVGSAVATAPEFELLLAVVAGFADLLAVAFLVEVAFVLVAAGVGESVAVAVATAEGVDPPIAPPPIAKDSVDENCGGVITMTAPRPPKVPPAINNARFILCSLSSLLT